MLFLTPLDQVQLSIIQRINPPRPYVIKKIACVFVCHIGSRLFVTVPLCFSFHTLWCRSIHGNPAESVFHCSHFCMHKNCISPVKNCLWSSTPFFLNFLTSLHPYNNFQASLGRKMCLHGTNLSLCMNTPRHAQE